MLCVCVHVFICCSSGLWTWARWYCSTAVKRRYHSLVLTLCVYYFVCVCLCRHKCTWGCPCLQTFWKPQSCSGWDTEYLHHCHFSTLGRQEAVDGENKSFVRMGQVETTTPFVPLEQVMDLVNEKRQGLTHFQVPSYSNAYIDLAVHTCAHAHAHTHTRTHARTHAHTLSLSQMGTILAVMQSCGKWEGEALSSVYITVII